VAKTVADQFAETLATAGIKRIYGIVADSLNGLIDAVWSPYSPDMSWSPLAVYRVIRHPSYLGLLVSSLGWALAFRSAVGVLLAALLVPPLLARIRAEEALLRAQFGGKYEAYCSRTSRLIPGLY